MDSDLISEILVRLPVKSIVRFKCVDPSWSDLFTTPTFANTHILRHNHKQDRLMIFDNQRTERAYHYKSFIAMVSDDDDVPPSQVEPPFPNDAELEWFRVLGPHKGVFCLYVYYRGGHIQLLLWNPATRDVKVLPPPPTLSPNFYTILLGFGADPNTNDFKLINLIIDKWNWQPSPSAELYTLSANTWIAISRDTVPVGIPYYTNPVWNEEVLLNDAILANGVCHWFTVAGKEETSILCFDFRDNRFRRLDLPPQTIDGTTYNLHGHSYGYLIEANDSIGYVLYRGRFPSWTNEIWILGQDNSWTKKYKFGPLDWHLPIYTFWKNGVEFLGSSNDTRQREQILHLGLDHPDIHPVCLVSYNSSYGQPVCHFEVTLDPYYARTYFRVFNYMESIVPISF